MAATTRLRIKDLGWSDEDFLDWLQDLSLPGALCELYFDDNLLSAASLEALSEHPLGVPLSLSLEGNPLGDMGAELIGAQPYFASLQRLNLARTGLSPQGLKGLLRILKSGLLSDLNLSENPLGDEGLKIILESPQLQTLRQLSLNGVGLTDESVERLLSPRLWGLESLSLAENDLSLEARAQIRESLQPSDCILGLDEAL